MGYILLAIESAITSTLLVGLGIALARRLKNRYLRAEFLVFWMLLLVALWSLAIAGLAWIQVHFGGAAGALTGVAVTAGLALVGAAMVIVGLRRAGPAGPPPWSWSIGQWAAASAVALLLTGTTWWNLDLAVRQDMAQLRNEAGTLALAVGTHRLPPSLNAAVLYERALDALETAKTSRSPDDRVIRTWFEQTGDPGFQVPPDALSFLSRNEQTLQWLRDGAERPGFSLNLAPMSPPFMALRFPGLVGHVPNLGQMLCLSARAHAQQGQLPQAMRDLAAAFALARHATDEPLPVLHMLAGKTYAYAFGTLQAILSEHDLTPEALDALEVELVPSFQDMLTPAVNLERANMLGIWANLDYPDVIPFIDPSEKGSIRHRLLAEFVTSSVYRVLLWRRDLASYRQWVSQNWGLLEMPYFRAGRSQATWQGMKGKPPSGPLAWHLAFNMDGYHRLAATADAQARLVALAQAMWRYRLDSGTFPEALEALVPAYLPAVPIDPFSGEPLRLTHRGPGQPVIYSIGQDLVDDGGTYEPGTARPYTTGDIVLVLDGAS